MVAGGGACRIPSAPLTSSSFRPPGGLGHSKLLTGITEGITEGTRSLSPANVKSLVPGRFGLLG